MGEGCRRPERDSGSAIAERKVGCVVELQRRTEIDACTGIYAGLALGMGVGECRREVDPGASLTRGAHGRDGYSFTVRRSADDQLVAGSERKATLSAAPRSIYAADFDIGRARARIR